MGIRDLLEILIHAILAIFGVAARELRYKDERNVQVARLISNAVIASFGAAIVYLVASMGNLPPQMGYITAGLVGWGGPQIIDRLFEKNVKLAGDAAPSPKKEEEAPTAEPNDSDAPDQQSQTQDN